MPAHSGARLDIGPVEFSDAVVAEPRPVADGVGTSLVPDEPQGELETQTVALVALIGDVHEGRSIKECISMENIPKQTLRSKSVWATISSEKTEECMATDKKSQIRDPVALATTETDFARSVDREIIRQVGGMNLRGLRILREALESSKIVLPAAASMLREDWLGLEDGVLASVADCPYLLFDLSTDTAFALWRRVQAGVSLPRLPPGLCEGQAGQGFARIVCYFAWQTAQSRPAAASLLLGLSPTGCAALRELELPQIDELAETAGPCVGLRWGEDVLFWRRRIQAAKAGDRNALWETTLAGVQRLAAVSRSSN